MKGRERPKTLRVRVGASGPSQEKLGEARRLLQGGGDEEIRAESKEIQRLARKLPRGAGPEAKRARRELEERVERLQARTSAAGAAREEEAMGKSDELIAAGLPAMNDDPRAFGLSMANRPEELFEARFDGEGYGAGDAVHGTLVATGRSRAKHVSAELCYVDASQDYMEGVTHDETGSLHRGSLKAGTEIPFTLRLPPDARPEYVLAPEQGAVLTDRGAPSGYLSWALVVHVSVPWRRDVEELHPLPLSDDPEAWRRAAPATAERPPEGGGRGWDVAVMPDRGALRRGEELIARVTVGEPASERGLRVGLVCEAAYDLQVGSTDSGYRRKPRTGLVHEEWRSVDATVPEQAVRLQVPAEAPFSYSHEGGAFGFEWKLVVLEERRMRRDPRREAAIEVAP